jgi:Cys-tRNA(Pro)/Cys-tRNA(Cys) deacylase
MSIPKKTNCCRILDSLNISYELLTYDWSEDALDAISVADKIHMPHEQVFKTLVLKGDVLAVFVIIVPGNAEVSLKKVAKSTGNTACSLLPISELYPLTGYIRGGCSPIGMKKHFPTFLECKYSFNQKIFSQHLKLQSPISSENCTFDKVSVHSFI